MSETSSSATSLSARDAIAQYVNSTTVVSKTLGNARGNAREYGVVAPNTMTGAALTSLMALISTRRDGHPAAVIVSPVTGMIGLHLAAGPGDDGVLTCAGPELEHQSLAKSALRATGIRPNRQRFLPSQPLEVMDRLATDSYDLVYLDVAPAILRAAQEKAWPLLRSGGALVLTGALLGDTIAGSSRTNRDTVAVRGTDEYMLQLDSAFVMHLPLAANTAVLVKE